MGNVRVIYYCEILLKSQTNICYNSAYLSGLDTHLLRIYYISDTNLPNSNSGGKSLLN